MAGGTPFYTTQTKAVEFPGGPSFAPLFYAKGGGLDVPAQRERHNAPMLPQVLWQRVVG
jgi:hypothetical protein